MSKARAAGILGCLTIVGMLVLTSLVVADNEKSYFANLKGAFTRGCVERAEQGLGAGIGDDAYLAVCSVIIHTLTELEAGDTEPEIADAFLDALAKETPGLRRRSTCDECVQAVQDLEIALAANNTVEDIVAGLVLGCEKRFSTLAKVNECKENVAAANIAAIVDLGLSELPPLVACRELNFCPSLNNTLPE